jgi:hypothetical protein
MLTGPRLDQHAALDHDRRLRVGLRVADAEELALGLRARVAPAVA